MQNNRFSIRSILTTMACLCLLILGTSDISPAWAQAGPGSPTYNGSPNIGPFPQWQEWFAGNASGTAGYTFATNSYADLTGATVSFVPLINDPTVTGGKILVAYWLDVGKATAGSGQCAAVVNGGRAASTVRTWGYTASGNEGSIGGMFVITNSTVGAQTIKLQCESSDTNTFTVNAFNFQVWDMEKYGAVNP